MLRSKWFGLILLLGAASLPLAMREDEPRVELPPFEIGMMTSSKTVLADDETTPPAASAEAAEPAQRDVVLASGEPVATERARVVAALQRELSRVGCYTGTADGQWSAATQEAMRAFAIRVGALVPLDEPSHILQTLVEGFRGTACPAACADGGMRSADGKCPVVVAQRSEKPGLKGQPGPAAPAKVAQVAPPVRIINQKPEDKPAQQPAAHPGAASATAKPLEPAAAAIASAGASAAAARAAWPPLDTARRLARRAPAQDATVTARLPAALRPAEQRQARLAREPANAGSGWTQPGPVARPPAGLMIARYVPRP